MSSVEPARELPPLELIATVDELLELLAAVADPIAERIPQAIDEALGLVELAVQSVELRLLAELSAQIDELPGKPAHN